MTLENVTGDLLAYKELEPGTFQRVDQLTTERRTDLKLRDQHFYTADGELYTVQKRKHLWAITREPQNLVLKNIDKAYQQLTGQGNYFPDAKAAQASLKHPDTVVVDLKGLKLMKGAGEWGHFVVDPKKVKKLNSEQRRAAQRIYGLDEDNFGLNMEMFAEAGKCPYIYVLMPDYVQSILRSNDKKFLARASWLFNFSYDSNFYANDRVISNHNRVRGVRKKSSNDLISAQECDSSSHSLRRVIAAGDAPKNEVPSAPQETVAPTMAEILAISERYILHSIWEQFQAEIRKSYKK